MRFLPLFLPLFLVVCILFPRNFDSTKLNRDNHSLQTGYISACIKVKAFGSGAIYKPGKLYIYGLTHSSDAMY